MPKTEIVGTPRSSPFREPAETLVQREVIIAVDVPSGVGRCGLGTRRVFHYQLVDTERDLECRSIERRCLIPHIEHLGPCVVGRSVRRDIVAIEGDAHVDDPLGIGTSGTVADTIDTIATSCHAARIASLALKEPVGIHEWEPGRMGAIDRVGGIAVEL